MRAVYILLRLLIALTFFSPTFVHAQSIVGNTVLGGKRVELLSDGTWRYMPSNKPSGCVTIHKTVDFCGSILDWHPLSASLYGYDAIFQYDSRYYSAIYIQEVGMSDGIDFEYMRQSLLENIAVEASLPVEQISVLDVFNSSIDNKKTETLIYTAPDKNVDLIYVATTYVSEHQTVTAFVWGYGKEYSETVQAINSLFIESIKLNFEETSQ